jgi:DNA polymerase V
MCIDLKSFFASCECVERGIDGFTTPLVVANPHQGNGAITLAISPYLKKLGVASRSRLYDIPKDIKYQIVPPRMNLYISYSKRVVDVYLSFVAEDDILIYSIDECFLDVTNYLKMYKKTDYELAEDILKSIYAKTGLTANCGIGPNMLLAKVAMDTEAKLYKNGIAKWTYDDVKTKLWEITPLSKMWSIGKNMQRNLNNMGLYKVGDIAKLDKNILKKKYGIMGEELWNHVNGIDESRIQDYKEIAHDKSFSHSQVLFKDYNESNIKIIISEMIEVLGARLRKHHKQTSVIGFGIGYSKNVGGGFYHSIKIVATDQEKDILNICLMLFDKYYENLPIRKVSIACAGLVDKEGYQLNLFEEAKNITKKEKINTTVDEIKERFGKNSLVKASALYEDSTAIERNKKIGGHHA